MPIDFKEIENERVGYDLRANMPEGPFWLEIITFGEFIPPYVNRAKDPQQVYQRLKKSLDSAIEQQDSVTDRKRHVMLDVLAKAALQREAIINSMGLIQTNYLKDNEVKNAK